MKVVVLSDTHGLICDNYINKIKEIENVELIIHAGDYSKDAKKISRELGIDMINVKGNCDYDDKSTEEILEIELEGKKFYITHGDKLNIKASMSELIRESIKYEADIVIFGHTHQPFNSIIDGVLYFNPGSATCPIGKESKTFGIIEIVDGKIKSELVYI